MLSGQHVLCFNMPAFLSPWAFGPNQHLTQCSKAVALAMGKKRSRSSSDSSSDSSSSDKKKKKKEKKEKKKKKEKKEKKKKDKKDKKEKNEKKEVSVLVTPTIPRLGVAEERERLLRAQATGPNPSAATDSAPARFDQAKARLEALRAQQQKPEKSVLVKNYSSSTLMVCFLL